MGQQENYQAEDEQASNDSKSDGQSESCSENRKSVFRFWNVNALSRLDDLEIDLRCESNLWEKAAVKGKLDPQDLTGKGQIDLTRFRPQVLTNYLYPQSLQGIRESQINLNIDFQTYKRRPSLWRSFLFERKIPSTFQNFVLHPQNKKAS